MYSADTIATYAELLKAAGFAIDEAIEKDAGVRDFARGVWNGAKNVGRKLRPRANAADIALQGRGGRNFASQLIKGNPIAGDARAAEAVRVPTKNTFGGKGNGVAGHQAEMMGEAQDRAHSLGALAGENRALPPSARSASPALADGPITQVPASAPRKPGAGGGASKAQLTGKHIALMGGAAAAGGVGAYHLGSHLQARRDKTQRNLAFGAGAALGLAAPPLLRGVANTANNLALQPSSLLGGGY